MSSADSFGSLVRRRRRALDLTQAALARQVGCAESLIRKIESEERRPSRQIAALLAEALQIAPDERDRFVRLARGEQPAERLDLAPPPGQAAPPLAPPAYALPAPPTELIGRETELQALDGLLADPAIRLLTIVAPGGTGKTRLALAVCARQRAAPRFPDGVCFVDLTAVEQTAHVASAIATALGLPLRSGGSSDAQLLAQLSRRRMLLALDNAEQLLDAAPLLSAMLGSAPGLVLLITSRLRLQLQAEQLFPLGGLSSPADPALAARSAASRLFLQAARRSNPGWTPTAADLAAVGAICRLVGGLPLALELAGAWAGVLSPAEILAELRRGLDILASDLRDLPERQRSVRAVLDSAWRHLRPALRDLFARLAVFTGGFSRAAAEQVAAAGLHDLADLSAAALLSYDPARARYTLHTLLHQYAAARLAEAPALAERSRDAHAAFYCAYLAHHGAGLPGAQQQAARAALEREQENCAVAWRRAVQLRDPALLAMAAQPLTLFYILRADTMRGALAFNDEVIALAREAVLPVALRARLLISCSAFRRSGGQTGDADEAAELARRALDLLAELRRAGAPQLDLEAYAHLWLGHALDDLEERAALEQYELALQGFRALGRAWDESYVLYQLGRYACQLGQLADAAAHSQASLTLRESLGDKRGVAHSLVLLSQVACAAGRRAEALDLARRGHLLFTQLADLAGIAKSLRQLGAVLLAQGRREEAHEALERSAVGYEELGLLHERDAARAMLGRSSP